MTKKELTKQKIQQAAFKCVARYGFEKTTLDDIAQEVGLNKASLYYYYKNKEDIFLDITSSATRAFLETLKQGTLAVSGGIEAQTRHFLLERSMYYVRMVAQTHISEETLLQVEHLFWEQIKDVQVQEQEFLGQLLQQAIDRGALKLFEAPRMAQNLVALSEAIKKTAKEKHPEQPNSEAIEADISTNIDFMLNLLFGGLRP